MRARGVPAPFALQMLASLADDEAQAQRVAETRRRWKSYEDALLIDAVTQGATPEAVFATRMLPGRSEDSIRNRVYKLRHYGSLPESNGRGRILDRHHWTEAEDRILGDGILEHGRRWRAIGQLLQGRSPSSIRNRFERLLRDRQNGTTLAQPLTEREAQTEAAAGAVEARAADMSSDEEAAKEVAEAAEAATTTEGVVAAAARATRAEVVAVEALFQLRRDNDESTGTELHDYCSDFSE